MSRSPWCLPAIFGAVVMLGAADPPDDPLSFRRDVAPILVADCLGCHNDEKAEGGLNMATFAGLLAGGEVLPGESVVPGDPEASYLIEVIQHDAEPRMPYRQPPLADESIAILEQWVREGAVFDGPSISDTPLATLVDPLAGLPEIAAQVPTAEPSASVAYAPDGSRVAVGRGSEVHVFDPRGGGAPTATLSGHAGRVAAVGFTPDGLSLIAAGGRPGLFGEVSVWDLANLERRLQFRGHRDAILATALSADGQTLATASYDGSIVLWDARTGTELRTLKEHTDAVHAVAFSPDGTQLASASGDRTIKVWEVGSGTRLLTLPDATAEQYAVTFGAEGSRVYAAGADRIIRAWRLDGGSASVVAQAIAHDGAILRLVADPGSQTLYSAGEDRRVMVWDLETLAPKSTLPVQPDWPLALAIAPDGSTLAVGRYDGSLALLDPHDGREVATLLGAPTPPDAPPVTQSDDEPEPELVRDVTLGAPNPKGATRGQALRVTLTGRGVHNATRVVFADPGLNAQIVEPDEPAVDQLAVDLTIAPDARPGLHRFLVQTPLGTPGSQVFAVSAYPETAVTVAGGMAAVQEVTLPTTLVGRIQAPGETNQFQFRARAGQVIVAETLAQAIGSRLAPVLELLDSEGHRLAEARGNGREPDPILAFTAPREGTYTLRVSDALLGGSGGHDYRVTLGELPRVQAVEPLGVEPATTRELVFEGVNLGEATSTRIEVAPDAEPGTLLPVVLPDRNHPTSALTTRRVVVAAGPQGIEVGERPSGAAPLVATPGGVTGRIGQPGEVDLYRFVARKGQRLIVEVYGRRLGSEIDPAIEILDESGKAVPRAVLKPVATTNVAFRDHGARDRNIRLTTWGDLQVGDYLLAGRELMRLTELPRNPDDDAIFWGLGIHRNNMGERVALLETTPEHHPQDQLIRKVEIHPPGTTFPPGGAAPITLPYRNDDAGPGFERDARLTFDPPADGTYLIRVEDARGFGGDRHGYHLVVRETRPDFALSLSAENPHIRRGGATILTVNIRRVDGFEGPVDVSIEGLPPGLSATSTRIEAGLYAADLLLMAAEDAPELSNTTWTVTGMANGEESLAPEGQIRHTIDPGGPEGGWITVAGEPNVRVTPSTDRVVIRPGQRVTMNLAVERRPPFDGRVPIDVRNLPLGVRVENIGLNGVLVTEEQTEREVSLYAEPWAEPMERPFFAVGQCEAAGTGHSSPPIWLVVEPEPGARPVAAATRVTPN